MKSKRLSVAQNLGRWCISVAIVITLGVAHSHATEPVLGGSKTPATGAAGGATSEGASSQLEHCDESLGTMAVVEDQTAPWYGESLAQYKLGSTVPVLRMMIQQSNCFVVVERGRAMNNMMQERALEQSGEMREGSNFGKGQMVAADYTMSPSITFSQKGTGGVGGALGGLFGSAAGLRGCAGGRLEVERSFHDAAPDRQPLRRAAGRGRGKREELRFQPVRRYVRRWGGGRCWAATPTRRRERFSQPLSWIPTTSWSGPCVTTRRRRSRAVSAQVGALACKGDRRRPRKS